jgi:hypothetical protein
MKRKLKTSFNNNESFFLIGISMSSVNDSIKPILVHVEDDYQYGADEQSLTPEERG